MKKSVLFMTAVFALVLVLVACGGGDDEPVDQGSSDSDEQNGGTDENNGNDENAAESAQDTVDWQAYSTYPSDGHIGEGLIEFSERVNEETAGAVSIDVVTDGALGYEGPELLQVVQDNLVTVSDMMVSGVAGDERLFEITSLPFLYRDLEESRTLDEVVRPYYDEVMEEEWNQKILYMAPWPISGFWSQHEINTIEDMEGLATRTYDEMGALVLESIGGTPHPLPFGEVYSALSTGVIDSVLTSTVTAVDANFWEVLDYYSPLATMAGRNPVTVNLDEFNALDEETQETLIRVGEELEDEMWDDVAALDEEMEAIVNENGITTVEPSEELIEDLEEGTQHIIEEWLETAPDQAQDILDEYYEAVGR